MASGNPVPACALPTKFLFLSYANIFIAIVPTPASNSSNNGMSTPTCEICSPNVVVLLGIKSGVSK